MKKIALKTITVATISALTLISGTALADEIKTGGGGSAMSTIFIPVKANFEKKTGITLINLQSSPKDGLVDLIKGKVEVAVAAVSLEGMIAGAGKDGVAAPANLVKTVVGTGKTMIYVHPSNKVNALTKEQLKGIFTGTISNWKEVGGDDKDILVIWGKGTPGQNAQFVKEVLDGGAVVKDALETTNYAKIKETVSATPEGIGIDPIGMGDTSVKIFDAAPVLTSPIIAVTIGQPSANVQKLIDYVKGEGRQFTKQ